MQAWICTQADSTLRRHHLEKAVRWIDVKTLTRLLSERLPRELLVQLLALDSTSTEPPASGGSHG